MFPNMRSFQRLRYQQPGTADNARKQGADRARFQTTWYPGTRHDHNLRRLRVATSSLFIATDQETFFCCAVPGLLLIQFK